MESRRCENGHYYDPEKHSSCPHCGVNIDLDPNESRNYTRSNPEGLTGVRGSSGAEGKTIAMINKQLGIDPVVGWLVCVEGPDRGRDYRLRSEKNFIGRSEKMDICIAGDGSISRENHATVSHNPKNNSFKIYPGEGRGLVYLNSEEVDTPRELNPYDTIELGQTKLIFVPLCGEAFSWD